MFAINKKEAPIGTHKLFKKADPSNRVKLRQNHLNFEASFTPNDIIEERSWIVEENLKKGQKNRTVNNVL